MSDLHIPHAALREYINNAIHVVVQIDRGADGLRRVVEVAVVASRRGEPFRLQTAMQFEADPLSADRRVTGRARHYALPDRIAEHLTDGRRRHTAPRSSSRPARPHRRERRNDRVRSR